MRVASAAALAPSSERRRSEYLANLSNLQKVRGGVAHFLHFPQRREGRGKIVGTEGPAETRRRRDAGTFDLVVESLVGGYYVCRR